jgi:uncharacterized protein YndB with AHSA1/START domain
MVSEDVTLEVSRPPGDVFAFLVEPANTPRWVKFCQTLTKIGDAPTAVGTRLHYTYKDGLRRGSMDGQVTEHQPNERLAYLYTDKMLDVAVGFRFAPSSTGTRIEHWCTVTPKNLVMKLMTPLIRSATKKQMRSDTARLKQILEGANVK